MRKTAAIIALFLTTSGIAQTATINSKKVFPNEEEKHDYIKFEFNGQSFGEKDTVIKVRVNKKGFDHCRAIMGKDTLNFLTEFRAGETYEIRQGCCCAAFILEAKKNPARGSVSFRNNSERDLALIVAEANNDTIVAGKSKTIFASESAMCYFKPAAYWWQKHNTFRLNMITITTTVIMSRFWENNGNSSSVRHGFTSCTVKKSKSFTTTSPVKPRCNYTDTLPRKSDRIYSSNNHYDPKKNQPESWFF